ncbi:MAG: metallopeptidase TldD-related protein [Ignisphaera sp.]|nr:metallopeptidase TldD-related protein [Ignisphaera sp.]MCX8167774.1 metallopeptidase TldD-related protein [Ignisphaera sp.]MDW8085239.1 metallopeptidase TldD-related protein [Ignisphaera sp.]
MHSIYYDKVKYFEDAIQIAYREDSLESNRLVATVHGYRFNKDGCWFITSIQSDSNTIDFDAAKAKAMKYLLDRSCGGFVEATLFKGYIEIGKESPQEDEVAELVRNLCDEAKTLHNVKCEIIVGVKTIERKIARDNNEMAHEVRRIVEIEIGLLKLSDLTSQIIATSYTAIIPWTREHVTKTIDVVFRETVNKLNTYSRARTLKPYQYGRANVVLGYEAAAALIHEISHLLEADHLHYGQKLIGSMIAPKDFNLYDNPHDYDSTTIRFFDDESVSTRKRTLIEDGIVRDLHHTRSTASIYGSEPGSAYGLFQRPTPLHTTLILKPGDWKETEMISETRNGFYIGGIAVATLERGYIRIIPDASFIIEGGELSEAVRIREVKIPLVNLKTINAISRTVRTRVSREKEWIVAEKAPYVRLEAFVA